MISLRHNLYYNYPERITSTPRDLYRRIKDDTPKLTLVCLTYVKCLAEWSRRICRPYNIRTIFTSASALLRYLFHVKPLTEFNMTKNCVYSISCSYGKVYKRETCHPLKIRQEEYRKAVVRVKLKSRVWRCIYRRKRETICSYGIKLK